MTDHKSLEEMAEIIYNEYGRKGSWNLFDKRMIGAITKALQESYRMGAEMAAEILSRWYSCGPDGPRLRNGDLIIDLIHAKAKELR